MKGKNSYVIFMFATKISDKSCGINTAAPTLIKLVEYER